MVRAFNEGRLRFLVCTSTLIEGVNTSAKNVIVLDNQIATQRIDYFTFSNIRGRSGRMFRHFTGNVFVFHDPPAAELPFVDFPVMTQPERTPTSLLIEVDEPDLSRESRSRVDPIVSQSILPMTVIRENAGVDPERQVDVARRLEREAFDYYPLIAWTGFPEYEQLEATCVLIWDGLLGNPNRRAGVSSGRQLAFKLNQLRGQRSIPHLLGGRIPDVSVADDVDEAVEQVLHFLRQWPGYEFPRLLTALDRIQRVVFESVPLRAGNYAPYAAQVENLFLPAPMSALEEYGVPIQLAEKLVSALDPRGDLDEVLERLRALNVGHSRSAASSAPSSQTHRTGLADPCGCGAAA